VEINKKRGKPVWIQSITKPIPAWWLNQLWLFIKELYFNVKFHKYEFYVPDHEKERKEALAKSWHRMRLK